MELQVYFSIGALFAVLKVARVKVTLNPKGEHDLFSDKIHELFSYVGAAIYPLVFLVGVLIWPINFVYALIEIAKSPEAK